MCSPGIQVTTEALRQRLADRAQRIEVMPNQLQKLPPLRSFPAATPASAERPLVIGWGGSCGHREDLRAIAPALIAWLRRQRQVRFELMGDPVAFGNSQMDPPTKTGESDVSR